MEALVFHLNYRSCHSSGVKILFLHLDAQFLSLYWNSNSCHIVVVEILVWNCSLRKVLLYYLESKSCHLTVVEGSLWWLGYSLYIRDPVVKLKALVSLCGEVPDVRYKCTYICKCGVCSRLVGEVDLCYSILV